MSEVPLFLPAQAHDTVAKREECVCKRGGEREREREREREKERGRARARE